jgi:hypothetical protein
LTFETLNNETINYLANMFELALTKLYKNGFAIVVQNNKTKRGLEIGNDNNT